MKQGSFLAFILQLFGITVVCYGALFIVFTKAVPVPTMPLELMLLMLFVVTGLAHFIILRSGKNNPTKFTYAFMFTSVIRLIIYGMFIILYGWKHAEIAKAFALTFFGLYLLYTIFEIRSILKYLKG
ncbi:MAG TPA: hypothetical protein VK806_10940 [Bacteroidia bacterium]|jgi:FtsH-binding integral membrane protein|nr:hypothetical protein [Bacteroidia bacterium]